MYVPPFDSLLQAFGMTRAEFERSNKVTIPSELFKLLLPEFAVHRHSDNNTLIRHAFLPKKTAS